MITLLENDDFILRCSGTKYDKNIIYLNSAAGLDRICLDGIIKPKDRQGRGIDGVYVPFNINEIELYSKNACWFQRDTIYFFLEKIQSIISKNINKTVIYGSSMGGFGAIHIGLELGITSIAFSPQVNLDKKFHVTPTWEKVNEYIIQKNGRFTSNIITFNNSLIPIYLFYDSHAWYDIKHASYILNKFDNCIGIDIPYAGHGCMSNINKVYRVKKIIMDILNGKFSKSEFIHDFFEKYNFDYRKQLHEYKVLKIKYNKLVEENIQLKKMLAQ